MQWFVISFDRRAQRLMRIVEFPNCATEAVVDLFLEACLEKAPEVEVQLIGARSVESLRIGYSRFFVEHPEGEPLPHSVVAA